MEGGEEAVRIWVLVFFLYVSCRVSRFRFFFLDACIDDD